jgi:hypothetical protein
MKKLILLILIVVGAVAFYKNKVSANREKLVGTWMAEQQFPGGTARMHLNLKPSGDFYLVADAAAGQRTAFGESTGTWEAVGPTLKMEFKHSGIPGFNMSSRYGGPIVKLDDTTLSYKSKDGVETWKRVR